MSKWWFKKATKISHPVLFHCILNIQQSPSFHFKLIQQQYVLSNILFLLSLWEAQSISVVFCCLVEAVHAVAVECKTTQKRLVARQLFPALIHHNQVTGSVCWPLRDHLALSQTPLCTANAAQRLSVIKIICPECAVIFLVFTSNLAQSMAIVL